MSAGAYVSHADLGGVEEGFGRIVQEPEGELFHAMWEPRALALTVAMGATGSWNIDASRSARETLPDYRRLSYYQVWLGGLERLLAERGLVRAQELATGKMLAAAMPVNRVLMADNVAVVLARGSPTSRPETCPARFQVGQHVRTTALVAPHHTRLPGYARGQQGVIERLHGQHVFADSNAQGLGEQPQWLYSVVFEGRQLWGPQTSAGLTVSIDAFEPYLEPL